MHQYLKDTLDRLTRGEELVVGYHADCSDGFCSAWLIWQRMKQSPSWWQFKPQISFHPLEYENPATFAAFKQTLIDGHHEDSKPTRHFLLVDFSYPVEEMQEILNCAVTGFVIDHHRGAEPNLVEVKSRYENFDYIYDVGHSGAMLTWKVFGRPNTLTLALYCEDRDLWQFKLPHSKEVNAYIRSVGHDFDEWEHLSRELHNGITLEDPLDKSVFTARMQGFVSTGAAIIRNTQFEADMTVRNTLRYFKHGDSVFPVINISRAQASDALNRILNDFKLMQPCKGPAFAAAYYDSHKGKRVWSLRSPATGANVGAMAATLSTAGGGHDHAAGFTTELDFWWDGMVTPDQP